MKNIQDWINENVAGDGMLWKGAFGEQMVFLRDVLPYLICKDLDYEDRVDLPKVISTHHSKSIVLPVVEYNRKDLGLRMIVRDNFYNWKLSVISEKPIEIDFSSIFYTTPPVDPDYTGNPLRSVYFEGFPNDLIFGYYSENKSRWSAEIHGDHNLYMVVFLIMQSFGVIKPLVWATDPRNQSK